MKKIAVENNILIKDWVCTAGSKMMDNFVSPISATVYEKITAVGAEVIQAQVSEFGISNPLKDNLPKNGGVEAVKNGECEVALCSDYNGAVRNNAQNAGICFVKPTYGTVSRFGLVSFAQSMEQIGVAAKSVEDAFDVLSAIAGYDSKDGTSYQTEKYEYFSKEEDLNGLKIANLNDTDFEFSEVINDVSYIISCAEGSNNLSRFDGVKFGYRSEQARNVEELYVNTRSEGFEFDTKIADIMGAFVLSQEQYEKYYVKAMKVRGLMKESIDRLFEKYDCLILPSEYSSLANLTGSPAMTVSCGDKTVQLMAKQFNENVLLRVGKCFQKGVTL